MAAAKGDKNEQEPTMVDAAFVKKAAHDNRLPAQTSSQSLDSPSQRPLHHRTRSDPKLRRPPTRSHLHRPSCSPLLLRPLLARPHLLGTGCRRRDGGDAGSREVVEGRRVGEKGAEGRGICEGTCEIMLASAMLLEARTKGGVGLTEASPNTPISEQGTSLGPLPPFRSLLPPCRDTFLVPCAKAEQWASQRRGRRQSRRRRRWRMFEQSARVRSEVSQFQWHCKD